MLKNNRSYSSVFVFLILDQMNGKYNLMSNDLFTDDLWKTLNLTNWKNIEDNKNFG